MPLRGAFLAFFIDQPPQCEYAQGKLYDGRDGPGDWVRDIDGFERADGLKDRIDPQKTESTNAGE